jgi:acyl-CoA thioester hydrolase
MPIHDLVETYRGTIYPWHCDHLGHMNAMWYVGKFDEATWNLFAAIGITTTLEVREKVAKFVHEMRSPVTGEVSAICVLTGVHTDAQTRKSCPFPPEIVERARGLVRAYELPR